MAKACAYLCRYCRFIEGFREFGENIRSKRRTQIVLRHEKHSQHFRRGGPLVGVSLVGV